MSQKINIIYNCNKCGAQFPKWSGRCLECGAWGTLEKEILDEKDYTSVKSQGKNIFSELGAAEALSFKEIKSSALPRFATGLGEIDRVLGGGLTAGSLILLGGEPGIGKSTILAQVAEALSQEGQEVLYVSGEESGAQLKGRFERLGAKGERIKFVSEIKVEKIIATALKYKPTLLIIDSIQTVYSMSLMSEAGNISQIRLAAIKFLELAKNFNIAVCLIGHITKDGQIAGPKSLEHIVDTVVYLERDPSSHYSILRANKNRFGSLNELGILEMSGQGFKEVANPTTVFLGDEDKDVPGSALSCIMEGTRPFLVNIQALVSKTIFGYPQRKASGFDLNRLQVLAAVLSKREKYSLATQDIILNIVGGLKVDDPALDLAAALAIISSLENKKLNKKMIILGELGLGGELRNVSRLEDRLKEADKLGFELALVPASFKASTLKLKNLKFLAAKDLKEATDLAF